MNIQAVDWIIIGATLVLVLAIGLYYTKKSGKNPDEFFLSGRDMPWWLLGFSMVATTFSADTPNLVTDIVRKDGVAGNWAWWAFPTEREGSSEPRALPSDEQVPSSLPQVCYNGQRLDPPV